MRYSAEIDQGPAFGERDPASVAYVVMIRALPVALSVLVFTAAPAAALQSLIPSPYPSGVPGATPLDPQTPDPDGPQTLMRDPYPQILGEESQGNPPIVRPHRHQRLIPTIHQRKYRVDRH